MRKKSILFVLYFYLFLSCATTYDDIHRWEVNGPKSVPKLIKIVTDNSYIKLGDVDKKNEEIDLKISAINALGRIGDTRAVDPLIALIGSEEDRLLRPTIYALGKIGDVRAVKPILSIINDDYKQFRPTNLRTKLIEALSSFGSPAVEILIQEIRDYYWVDFVTRKVASNRDRKKCQIVIEALGQIGDFRATQPIIEALNEKRRISSNVVLEKLDSDEKKYAVRALGKIRDPKSIEELISQLITVRRNEVIRLLINFGEPAIEPLISYLNSDYDSYAAAGIAEVLGEIGDQRANESLIALLDDEKEYTRKNAAEALGQLRCSRAAIHLTSLLKDPDKGVRLEARLALIKIGEVSVEPLIEAIQDSIPFVRSGAVKTLGSLKDARAVNPLIHSLKDSVSDIRNEAGKALAKIGKSAVEPLVGALNDDDESVRYIATRALHEIADPIAVGPLSGMLRDEIPAIRIEAISALSKIGDPKAVEPLFVALQDEIPAIRSKALKALDIFADPRAIKPLISSLKDSEQMIRYNARWALKKLKWEPTEDADGAWYWIDEKAFDKCVQIGILAIVPLMVAWDEKWSTHKEAKKALDEIIKNDPTESAQSTFETLYFEKAHKTNTIASYKKFLKLFPTSKHARAAERNLKKLTAQLRTVELAVKKVIPEGARLEVIPVSQYPLKPVINISTHLLEDQSDDDENPYVRGDYASHEKLTRFIKNRCVTILKSLSKTPLNIDASIVKIDVNHGVRMSNTHNSFEGTDVARTIYSISISTETLRKRNISSMREDEIFDHCYINTNIISELKFIQGYR